MLFKKLGRRGLTVTLGFEVMCVCVTIRACVNYWVLNCVCVSVKLKKVNWELRGNVKYSCSTDSRLANSNTPGCSSAAIVATEVT